MDADKTPRPARLEDAKRRPPVMVTSKYVDDAGNPLQFGVKKISARGLRELRGLLDAEGKAKDGDEEAVQRKLVLECVEVPKLTDAAVADLQDEDGFAWSHLVDQVGTVNGFSPKAQEALRKTFPPGNDGPAPAPGGS